MATLFLSYQHEDDPLARALELRLIAHGHSFKIPVSTKIAGDWRAKLMNALAESDAVVFLLSERGLGSPYVLGQIGSARAYAKSKAQLMLPVLVGGVGVPKFVADVQCFELATHHDRELDRLAEEIHQAVEDYGKKVPKAPRIFISHRHKDETLAAALVSVLEAAFQIGKEDIRCTSVQPYALPPGERVSERLRTDVNGAELVIGLIGPETSESRYVLFELGASWGRDALTFPVLVRGATADDVPGPLSERLSVSLEDEASCLQLIDDIADGTSLQRRQRVTGRVAEEAKKLAKLASQREARGSETEKGDAENGSGDITAAELERMGQHITNYLNANGFTMVSFERVRQRINLKYSDEAMSELIDKFPTKFRRANLKGGRAGIGLVA